MELKGRAIEIIKSFSKEEINKFTLFLESPLHNANSRLTDFFNAIKKFHPIFNQKEFTDENIYALVFGNAKYNYQVLKNLMSQLNKKAGEFFILQGLFSDEKAQKNYLLRELDTRNIENSFKHELEKAKKQKKAKKQISYNDFIFNAELASREANNLIFKSRQNITGSLKIEECENIALYFFNAFSCAYSTVIFNELSYNIHESSELIDSLLAGIDFEKLEPLLKQQKSRSHLVEHKLKYLKACYKRFKDMENIATEMHENLMKNINIYDESFKYDLILDVKTLFTAEVAAGRLDNINRFKDLTKYMFENKLLIRPGQKFMEPGTFALDLKIIMFCKDFLYAEEYIKNCEKLLPESERNDSVNFAYAMLYLYTEEFNMAIEKLSKITKLEFSEKYYVKGILLRCFYELKYYDELFLTIESYRTFLYRNKNISALHKEHNIVFLSFIEKLAKLKIKKDSGDKPDKLEIETLKHEIKSAERVNSRNYLLEKADEMFS